MANARVWRLMLNDLTVQENVEVSGGTISHLNIPEAAADPLMLQGDHGPVAFHNLYIRKFDPSKSHQNTDGRKLECHNPAI
jgi:hypothetical protein